LSRRLCCALALIAAPQLAAAGPVTWNYHTEVTYAQDYGSKFVVTFAPDGTISTEPGEQSFAWLFNSTGVSRPDPGSYEARYEFTVAVTLTDLASGQSGTVGFDGSYSSMWMYQPEDANNPNAWRWEYEASNFGDFWSWRTLHLGNNQYDIRGYGGGSGTFPFGEMNVDVHPTAATPEPTTLALAGLGLCGMGVARRLRKK
jgi:hypothetical protein